MKRHLLVVATASTLSACGSSSTAPRAPVQTPPDSQVIDPSISPAAFSADPARVSITGARAAPERLQITIDGETYDFDTAGSDTISPSGVWEYFTKGDGSVVGLIDTQSDHVVNFRIRSEEEWNTPFEGGILAVGVDGSLTPLDAIPTTGSATYDGFAIGYMIVDTLPSDGIYTTRSNVTLDADFVASEADFVAFGSVIFSPTSGTTSFGSLDAQAALEIADGKFQGTMMAPGTTDVIGNVDGNFYGPSADAIAGTMDYSFRNSGRTTFYTGVSSFTAE